VNKMPTADKSTISLEPQNIEQLCQFFRENKDEFHEIWIVLTKKEYANPQPVSFQDAVNEAIKQGLIDSRTKSLNEQKYAIRFTKRISESKGKQHLNLDWKSRIPQINL
jgi:hypothetical protein